MRMCWKKAAGFLLPLFLLPGVLLGAGASLPSLYQESYYAELSAMTTFKDGFIIFKGKEGNPAPAPMSRTLP